MSNKKYILITGCSYNDVPYKDKVGELATFERMDDNQLDYIVSTKDGRVRDQFILYKEDMAFVTLHYANGWVYAILEEGIPTVRSVLTDWGHLVATDDTKFILGGILPLSDPLPPQEYGKQSRWNGMQDMSNTKTTLTVSPSPVADKEQEESVIVPMWQFKRIANALRLAANTLESHSKETAMDREIMLATEYINSLTKSNNHGQ